MKDDVKDKLIKFSNKAESLICEGQAGGNFVKVKLNGDFDLLEISYEKNDLIINDLDMFVDLLKIAFKDAVSKVKDNLTNLSKDLLDEFSKTKDE